MRIMDRFRPVPWKFLVGHNLIESVKILMIVNPTGYYMLASSGLALFFWGIFHRFFLNDP